MWNKLFQIIKALSSMLKLIFPYGNDNRANGLEAIAEKTITTEKELREELNEINNCGYALCRKRYPKVMTREEWT